MLRNLQNISRLLALTAAVLMPARLRAEDAAPPTAPTSAAPESALRLLVQAAKQRAPEVSLAQAQLSSSRSMLMNGRMAPLGNPYLEVTAERGDKNVTKDVAINGTLWLPLELSGQRQS